VLRARKAVKKRPFPGIHVPFVALHRPPTLARMGAGWRVAEDARYAGMAQQKDDTVLEAQRSKLKPPPMFKVMLLNDDYTPMEFVVLVLQKFFGMTRERATQVMLKVHREGIGICGVFPQDVANTKVQQVAAYSRKHQHPLQCVMEPQDE